MILVKKCTQFESPGAVPSNAVRLLPKRATAAPPRAVKAKRKRRDRSHERERTEIIKLSTSDTAKVRQRWTSVDGARRRVRSSSFSPQRSTEERRFRPRPPPKEASNPSLSRSNQVKQRLSDKEQERLASDQIRRQQRREIYALNALMAEHERSCFEQYLKTNGNWKMASVNHAV